MGQAPGQAISAPTTVGGLAGDGRNRAESAASDRERCQQETRSRAHLIQNFCITVEHADRMLIRPTHHQSIEIGRKPSRSRTHCNPPGMVPFRGSPPTARSGSRQLPAGQAMPDLESPADPGGRISVMSIGILAFGSIINEPGEELAAAVTRRIEVETPVAVEFARSSRTRDGAPTLVPVNRGAAASLPRCWSLTTRSL